MWMLGQSNGVSDFTSLGAAGVMGAMWLWERQQSRKRDEQLDEAHTRIMADGSTIAELVDVVKGNTQVMTRLVERLDQTLDKRT